MTAVERCNAREKFSNAPQPFEGAVDCTHINIIAPKNHEEAYMNHHENLSLNVQAGKCKILSKTVVIKIYK